MLRSQQISVIWEAPDTDLKDNLDQLKYAGLTLPDLLIVDVQCLGDNPYAFCRWCRENHPEVKVLLTNVQQTEISSPEREWAIHQGAANLLPGFQRDNLVSSATTGVKCALEVLKLTDLNDGALISVLLKLRRELEMRRENNGGAIDPMAPSNGFGDPTPTAPVTQIQPSNTALQPQNPASQKNLKSQTNGSTPPTEPQQPKFKRSYRGIEY